MAGIRIEFAQFGYFDSFDVIRSNSSMTGIADNALPTPIATGLKTMYYVDSDVVKGLTYYYKVRVWRNDISFLSDEISALAGELWTPNQIATFINLVADNSVINPSNLVSQITDSSGNNRNAVQSIDSRKPILTTFGPLSQKALQFDGSDDFLFISDTEYTKNKNSLWVFWVDQPTFKTAYTSVFYIVYNGFGGSKLNVSLNSGKTALGGRRTASDNYAEVTNSVNVSGQIGINFGQINFTLKTGWLFRDGVQSAVNSNLGTAGSSDAQGIYGSVMGAYVNSNAGASFSEGYIGKIGCVIIGGGVLSIDDQQRLEGWAAHKYGLTSKLASDHPYKTIPPIL